MVDDHINCVALDTRRQQTGPQGLHFGHQGYIHQGSHHLWSTEREERGVCVAGGGLGFRSKVIG